MDHASIPSAVTASILLCMQIVGECGAAVLPVANTTSGNENVLVPFPGSGSAITSSLGSYVAGVSFGQWIRPIVLFPRDDFALVEGTPLLGARLRFSVVDDLTEPGEAFGSQVRLFVSDIAEPLANENAGEYAALTGDAADFEIVTPLPLQDNFRGELVFDLPPAALARLDAAINDSTQTVGVTIREIGFDGLDEFIFDGFTLEVRIAGPEIVIAPTGIDFGDVLLGSAATAGFAIANPGADNANLSIASIGLSADTGCDFFTITAPALPITLSPGETLSIPVTFSPLAFGPVECSVEVASDAPLDPVAVVPVGGTGDAPVEVARTVISPTDLDGSNGFTMNGEEANAASGNSLRIAGDVNGDGIDDIVVAKYSSVDALVYVVFGTAAVFPPVLELAELDGTNGFAIDSGDRFLMVRTAGDINGDGIDDLLFAGFFDAYVVFGGSTGFPALLDATQLDGSNGFVVTGATQINDVNGAGDVNGDGFDDIIIGDPEGLTSGEAGKSFVVFGSGEAFDGLIDLQQLGPEEGFRLDGVAQGDASGWSVSGLGDVNGDDLGDIVVGAPNAGEPLRGPFFFPNPGRAYVIYGSKSGFPPTLSLDMLDGNNGFAISGANNSDFFGTGVADAGDVNGDGLNDVLVGALQANGSGSGYVLYGSDTGFPALVDAGSLNGQNGFELRRDVGGDLDGSALDGAGDVNGDGLDDILIGADAVPNGITPEGEAYLVFGRESGPAEVLLEELNLADGFSLFGAAPSDRAGPVGGRGDVNGDGFADVLIGAPLADPNGSTSGQSYAIFGGRAPVGVSAPQINPGQFGICVNAATGQQVVVNPFRISWNCEAAGLSVAEGDTVELFLRGRSDVSGESIEGRVAGLAPGKLSGQCINLSSMTIGTLVTGTAFWRCELPGDGLSRGDIVDVFVTGTVAPQR